MHGLRHLALALVVALGTTACSGSDQPRDKVRSTSQPSTSASVTAASPETPASSPAEKSVPAALRFTATTTDGKRFDGASLAGRPAVLWFWAPWCTICMRESPAVGNAARTHPGVAFVGVAGLGDEPAMRDFVKRFPVSHFPHLASPDASLWTRFGVSSQPAFAFISADGTVDVFRGALSEQDIGERIRKLT